MSCYVHSVFDLGLSEHNQVYVETDDKPCEFGFHVCIFFAYWQVFSTYSCTAVKVQIGMKSFELETRVEVSKMKVPQIIRNCTFFVLKPMPFWINLFEKPYVLNSLLLQRKGSTTIVKGLTYPDFAGYCHCFPYK